MELQTPERKPETFIRLESLAGLHTPEALSLKLGLLPNEDKELINLACNKEGLPDLDYMTQTFDYFDIIDDGQRKSFSSIIGDIKMSIDINGKKAAVKKLVDLISG